MTGPFRVKPVLGRGVPEATNPQGDDELCARSDLIYLG